MSHDCISRINDQLLAHNTRLAAALSFSQPDRELIQITTVKAAPATRGKPVAMFASFCPFCGVSLSRESTNG